MPISPIDFVSPVNLVATVTGFFGGQIYLDPASSHNANNLIQATKYFCPEHQGLKQIWRANSVYLYPPRERLLSVEQPPNRLLWKKQQRFAKSAQRVWAEEMLRKYRLGEFEEGVLFLTSTEVALLVSQKIGLDLPLCVMREHPDIRNDDAEFSRVNTNKIYGFVYYFPSVIQTDKRIMEFKEIFSVLGRVYIN